jgi:hypothetical protein
MRLKLATAVLILAATLSASSSHAAAASSALARPGVRNGPTVASKANPPFAYVAEICRSSSSCPSQSGFVQMLGGQAITSGIEIPTTLALDASGNLYVGNSLGSDEGNVSVYAPMSLSPLRTLSGFTGVPEGLVADTTGRLFLFSQYREGCCQLGGDGEIYAPGGTQPQHSMKGVSGFAHSPALDKFGNLYVANFDVFPGWVSVYAPGKHVPAHVIATGIGLPIQLAVASQTDLVVLNGLFSGGNNVTVYPNGATAPSLTITAGLHASASLAVDDAGNIYVGNGRDHKQPGEVTVYNKGQTTISRTIQTGITFPSALAFDASGRLYVANVRRNGASTITVYAPGASTPLHTYKLAEQYASMAVPR